MAEYRRRTILLVQLLFGLAVVWFAGRALAGQWKEVERSAVIWQPRWALILISAAIVLATYLMLVHAWRLVLRAWSVPLPYREAMHIWFISNLGRYIPGKVWGLGTMGVMAHSAGISPVGAISSSMYVTFITLIAGGAVAAATGAGLLEEQLRGFGTGFSVLVQGVAIAASLAALLASPLLIPPLVRLAQRLFSRQLVVPAVSSSVVWRVTAMAVASWLLYGIAFSIFSAGILGSVSGPLAAWIGAYTWSYLLGFVSYVPGGLVVRELSLAYALTRLGLAAPDQAALLAVTSRLWLTPLEVIPGILFLLVRRLRAAPGQVEETG